MESPNHGACTHCKSNMPIAHTQCTQYTRTTQTHITQTHIFAQCLPDPETWPWSWVTSMVRVVNQKVSLLREA
jgi:predicted amidophosphoribosyltransferase